MIGEVDLIGSTDIMNRDINAFDRNVLSFFSESHQVPSQTNDLINQGSLKLDFVLSNFMLSDICLKVSFVQLSLQSTGSDVTMPYAEKGTSLNNSHFGLLMCMSCFDFCFEFGCI